MRSRSSLRAAAAAAAVAVAGTVALSCGGSRSPLSGMPQQRVLAFTPTEAVDDVEPISIEFDRPVVDAGQVGMPPAPHSVRITPATPWVGFWRDRQTLVLQPTDHLQPDTRYRVELDGPLATAHRDVDLAFVFRPLAPTGIDGLDPALLPTDGDLPLAFNLPVRPADVAAHCSLLAPPPAAPVALRTSGRSPDRVVTVHPVRKLGVDASYTLSCDPGLVAAGGDAPLAAAFTQEVHTRGLPAVTDFAPDGSGVVPADQVEVALHFATPMTLDAIHAAISSKPPIPGLADGYLEGDGVTYHVTADLDAHATYTVHLDPLADADGQLIAAPSDHTFRTGDARPRLSLERGIYALEASAKGYPIWTRNISTFSVQCAAIPRARITSVLTANLELDPWGYSNDDKPLEWAHLGLAPVTRTEKVRERDRWIQTPLDPATSCGGAGGKRGLFLAELKSSEVTPDPDRPWMTPKHNRVLVNATDLGVLVKVGSSSGVVWVTSFATGEPVAGAQVTVFTSSGRAAFTGSSDADGIVSIPGNVALADAAKPSAAGSGAAADAEAANDIDNRWSDGGNGGQRLITVVEKAGDLAVVDGNWSSGIQIWNYQVSEAPATDAVRVRAFIQSDRGLYRPGEQVHFKGLVREISATRPPRVPRQREVAVEITDARGTSIQQSTAKLTAFGGFAVDLQLAPDAALGDYYVTATVGTQTFRESFTVEEFRPAAFELAVTGDNAGVRPGDPLHFALDAKYLFGSPVAGAKVEWNLRKRTHYMTFPGFDEYTFSANPRDYWWDERHDEYGDFVADGKEQTDAAGHLAITATETSDVTGATDDATTPVAPARPTTAGPVDYIVSTSVTDGTDQTLQKSVIVTAHRTSMYLGIHTREYVATVDEAFPVDLVALTPAGARIATQAHLSLVRTEWSCTWGSRGYRGYTACTSQETPVLERDVQLGVAGAHTETLIVGAPGDYTVRVAGKDARGNDVLTESGVYAIGKGQAWWNADDGERMQLVTSKPQYAPGDTAKIVALANLVRPTALITVERDGVLSARVARLASTSEGLTLPVRDTWAPNVYASIAMVSGRHGPLDKDRPQLKLGTALLKVTSTHKQLDVAIKLDAATVRPGEPVSGTIVVTHAGAPVRAEVSLSAADEGVLQLIDFKTPNPMTTFYAPYGLGVEPSTNWNKLARLLDPTGGDPDQGADMASKSGPKVRSKFVASAYWSPALVTDAAGTIHFAFTAPDNLTAFRLMAVAADVGDQFGAGEARLTVNKPLMAQPALPRFLRTGDRALVGVLVHNTTAVAGTATIDATAVGARLERAHQTVALPAHGEARVEMPAVPADTASAATFQFRVTMGKEADAVAVTLPVEQPRLVETRTLVEALVDPKAPWTGTVETAPGVLRDESVLAFTIDRTGAGDLAPGLQALVEYPYGCLEQTMSHLVPLLAAKDLAATLGTTLDATKAQHFIDVGIAKILRHQQADGMFSLWPDSTPYPHLTAYALWGLTIAEQNGGVPIPADVFDRGIAALQGYANKHFGEDYNSASMAMAAYVMALRGKPDAGLQARLYAQRTTLPTWGRAFLLRAMALAKADRAQLAELQGLLERDLVRVGDTARVHETQSREELDMYWSSDVRSTAVTLLALMEVDPRSALIDPLAAGLKSERGANGAWASTQENVWALVALAQYARRGAAGDATVSVTVGGQQVLGKTIVGGEIARLAIPVGKLPAGAAIGVSVDHPAHVSARVTEARADAGVAEHHGFTVTRDYLDATGAPVTRVRAGDLVTVRIEIECAESQRWVAVDDPTPAGFEAVNTDLAESGAGADPAKAPAAQSPWSWDARWDYHELRDDRVIWFADRMSSGKHSVEYQVRATIAGTFTAMPATVTQMYHPEIHGRSDKTVVTVAP